MFGNMSNFVNQTIDDMEQYLFNWRQAYALLQRIMSSMEADSQGNYYIRRGGGMHYLPDPLNEALKDTEAYLNTVK